MCRFFGSFVAPVLAVGTLIAVGGAGYRVIGGGCPMCREDSQVKTTLVSNTADECCAGGPACPHDMSGCDMSAKTVKAAQPADGGCPFMNAASCDQTSATCAASPCCRQGAEKSPESVAATGK